MKMQEVRAKARALGIKHGNMKKVSLIRTIQEKEGHTQCYQTGINNCDQENCCWRQGCFTS